MFVPRFTFISKRKLAICGGRQNPIVVQHNSGRIINSGFQRKFITPDNSYAELITGDTTLSFASIELAKTNFNDGFTESCVANKPFGIEIGFTTDNVEATFDYAVKGGAIPLEKAKVKPHGQLVAYVKRSWWFLNLNLHTYGFVNRLASGKLVSRITERKSE